MREVRTIAVTSPGAADGKTVTAINLAGALGHGAQTRVLLIDADLRRPAVAEQLHVGEVPMGLAELASQPDAGIDQAIRSLDSHNIDVIAAGEPGCEVHEIFRSPRFEELLRQCRERYDYVVIDTPPLVPVVDSSLLARLVDGVLLVVAANRTPRKLLEEGLNQLDASKVLGIVFNSDRRPLYGYYDASYRRYFSRNHRYHASV